MTRSSFDELRNSGRLPSPTGVGMEILRLTQSDDCSASEIADVLRADPALTGRILQLANSAGGGSHQAVTTVNEATVRLGMQTIRNISLGFALVSSNRSGKCPAFDHARFWSESLARGVVLQSFSWRFNIGIPAEAFVLGLLADIGSLALATVHPETYSELLSTASGPDALLALEVAEFGIDHHSVTHCLLEGWGLAQFVDVLEGAALDESAQSKPGLSTLIKVSRCFSSAFYNGRSQPDEFEAVQALLDRFSSWKAEEIVEVWSELASEWRRWGGMLDVETPAVPAFETQPTLAEDPEESKSTDEAVSPIENAAHFAVPPLKVLRILAVDDESVSLRLLSQQLRNAGHQVITATNGREGLALAMSEGPQIVIADWMMPEMSGLEMCAALRHFEAGREMYFILLTGQADDDQIVEAFEGGVDDYIVKPFRPRILHARVRAGRRVIQLQQQVAADKFAMQHQVSQMGVLNRRLEKASRTDPLTGLPNRRAAMDELHRNWDFSERNGCPLTVVMIDIDHFKRVNDTHGHDTGDLVLVETTRILQQTLRSTDGICRLGGEEFLAIFPDCGGEGAIVGAERLREALASHRIEGTEFNGQITASFGLAERLPGVENVEELLKRADDALYAAKAGGRNRVSVAGEPVTSQ